LFLGQLGLLEGHKDAYQQKLKSEYAFLNPNLNLKKASKMQPPLDVCTRPIFPPSVWHNWPSFTIYNRGFLKN